MPKEQSTKPPAAGGKREKTPANSGGEGKPKFVHKSTGRQGNNNSKKRTFDSNKSKEEILAKRLKATAEAQRDARHELVVKCNKLWNDLRGKELEPENRTQLCTELFRLLKGKILSFAERPDTSRVIQSLFKFGDAMLRKALLDELMGHLSALSKGKHSAFLVVTLLRYGDEPDRSRIASELRANVRSLGTHANGARVVNYCLCGSPADGDSIDVISVSERKRFYEGFYGADIILLSGQAPSTVEKDYSLSQYLPSDESKRAQAIQYLKKLVLKIAEKGLLRFPYAQYLFYQVVANSPKEDIIDMIPSVSEAALAMVGTWEGALAVAQCLLAGDAKDRKKIIKEWKGHIVDLCAHRFGWYIVARAVDSVDDTKLIEKSIIEEMCEDSEKLNGLICQEDGFGRKVLMRILAPESRASHYFETFDECFKKDRIGLSSSKKDADVRNAEVFSKLKDFLFTAVANDAEEMLKSSRGTDVIRELFHRSLKSEDGGGEAKQKAIEALTNAAESCLDDSRGHATLKRIVKDEAEFASAGGNLDANTSLGNLLAKALSGKMAELAKTNRPAFVLEALATHPLAKGAVKKELAAAITELPEDVKGVEALLNALA